MIVQKFEFPNAAGDMLAAVLDLPASTPRAYALFAHCFTCGKDVLAARRISAQLTEHGLGVVRFDFTGLGASEGEFANSGFSSNVSDLLSATEAMRERGMAPALLIGHSLGGAAVLAVAGSIPEVRAVATIGAPFEPAHVLHLFEDKLDEIRDLGSYEVSLMGRPFRVTRAFLEDVTAQRLEERIGDMRKALLVFHSPEDEVVGIENASQIFRAAKHPKSFISLHGADHLMTRPADAAYVAKLIAAGAERYLLPIAAEEAESPDDKTVVVTETGFGRFQQVISASGHRLYADEPQSVGGMGAGPTPYDLLLSGLGACTSMTARLYADRKNWPLERTEVRLTHDRVHADDCRKADSADARIERIVREIAFHGPLTEEQRRRLLEMTEKCPVHRTLAQGLRIETRLAPAGVSAA
jgi:putative redox protein